MKVLHQVSRVNEWAVRHVAQLLATIWAVDVFVLLSTLPVLVQPSIFTVFYLSSGILQLVALPILAYMSDVIQKQGDAAQVQAVRLQQETHEMVRLELADIKTDMLTEKHIEELEARILDQLDAKLDVYHQKLLGAVTKARKVGSNG
jgi:competence protein ComGC